jgi:uncharacterized protein
MSTIKINPILLLMFMSFLLQGQMQSFSPSAITLLPSPFQQAQNVDLQYILKLNPDKLLAPYLIDAGLPLKESRYGNWESSGLDGHIAGHYLSALSMMYAGTNHAELKQRLDYMIAELLRCQKANRNGYVGGIPKGKVFWERIHKGDIDGSGFGLNNTWVPIYNIHKLFAGLRDAYLIGKNEDAKKILVQLSDWFIGLIKPLSDQQIQQILKTEHGGINETFVDVYTITKDKKYLAAAKKLSHLALLEPLLQKEDKLTGLHANTQIPKVIGFEKIAQITHNQQWKNAVEYFWRNVSGSRSVVFGGNSVREHFNDIKDFSSMLKSNQGPETCNSYNMLRLSKALYFSNKDPKYLDYYERTMYNHILSSQHPEKGGFVYFTPIRPNHYRVYSQPHTSMWCCVGSGLENHSKYGELIYSHTAKDLYINFFIASEVNWSEQGVRLIQHTKFPYENSSEIELKLKKSKRLGLGIRKPYWATEFYIEINGKWQPVLEDEHHVILIDRKWKDGDKVMIKFNTSLNLEKLPDGSNWVAFTKGPIVLAAKTSANDLDGLYADDSRMGHETKGKLYPLNEAHVLIDDSSSNIERVKEISTLRFQLDTLILQPFYEIHDSRYQMYFETYSQETYISKLKKRKIEEEQYLAIEARTIDKVNCGEQQPEVDHDFKGEKTITGNEEGIFWRSTKDYIAYTMTNENLAGSILSIDFIENYDSENTKIFINDSLVEQYEVHDAKVNIIIPKITPLYIKITSSTGSPTSKVHQLRVLKH